MEKIYKNRLGMFDFLKGLAMFLILTMYTVQHSTVYVESTLLHVLWFGTIFPGTSALMMATGYWFKSRSPFASLKEMGRTGLRIYGITAVGSVLAALLFLGFDYPVRQQRMSMCAGTALGFLLGTEVDLTLFGIPVPGIGAMWYVLAYVLGALLLNLLLAVPYLKEHRKTLQVALILLAMLGIVTKTAVPGLVYCIPEALVSAGVVYVGRQMKETGFLLRKWKAWEYVLLLLLTVGSGLLYYGFYRIGGTMLLLKRINMLICIPGGILMMRWSLWVSRRNSPVARPLKSLGRYSLWLLMLYTVETHCMSWSATWDALPGNEAVKVILLLLIRVLLYGLCVLGIIEFLRAWNHRKAEDIR